VVTHERPCEVSRIYYWLLVFACMNFMLSGSVFFLALVLFELFRRNFTVAMERRVMPVIVLVLSILVSSYAHYSFAECIKALNYGLIYIIGYDGYFRVTDQKKYVKSTMFAITVGFGVELILMFLYNYGREQINIRSMYSVWTTKPIAVTLLGLLAAVVIAYSFYAFFFAKNVRLKVVVLVMLIAGLWFGFQTATRTPLIMFCVVYGFMGAVYVLNKRGIKALGLIVWVSLLAVLLAILYSLDVFGVKSALLSTPVFQRMEQAGLETSRTILMRRHFQYMFDYLWGGDNIMQIVGLRAHNILQEGHDMYGIVTSASLVIIILQALGNMRKLLMSKNKSDIDFLFLSMYLAIVVQLFLEPVFNGYPILIWCFLLIHGIANAYMKDRGLAAEKNLSYQGA